MPKTKKSKKKSPTAKMSRQSAEGLVELISTARRYVKHPDVEKAVGFQVSTRTDMDLDEVEWYLKDNVIDPEGEGITAKDCRLIAATLRKTAELLASDAVFAIQFALPASTIASRLLAAASQVVR